MATYLLVYKGGKMPEGEAEQSKVMQAWGEWFGTLGSALADGGNPFGPSKSISSDGKVSDGAGSQLSGYSVITADNMDAAVSAAKGCPVLLGGASIEVYETFDVMAAMGSKA